MRPARTKKVRSGTPHPLGRHTVVVFCTENGATARERTWESFLLEDLCRPLKGSRYEAHNGESSFMKIPRPVSLSVSGHRKQKDGVNETRPETRPHLSADTRCAFNYSKYAGKTAGSSSAKSLLADDSDIETRTANSKDVSQRRLQTSDETPTFEGHRGNFLVP